MALAGRTDAGVHARGQVASFVTAGTRSTETFLRGANALLSRDISVLAVAEVPLGFDPRRQAVSRWYRYTLRAGGQRPALFRNLIWHVTQSLDLGAMAEAAKRLVGRHDFAAFTAPSEAKRRPTERIVITAGIKQDNGHVFFDIEANSFLPNMVRRIVGVLVEVGIGNRDVGEFAVLVREAQPGAASFMAPARGLCLMKVRYESGLFDDETNEDI